MEENKEQEDSRACRQEYTISEIWNKYQEIESDDELFNYKLSGCGFSPGELIMLIEILTVMRND